VDDIQNIIVAWTVLCCCRVVFNEVPVIHCKDFKNTQFYCILREWPRRLVCQSRAASSKFSEPTEKSGCPVQEEQPFSSGCRSPLGAQNLSRGGNLPRESAGGCYFLADKLKQWVLLTRFTAEQGRSVLCDFESLWAH
jgi:hypothetical protein